MIKHSFRIAVLLLAFLCTSAATWSTTYTCCPGQCLPWQCQPGQTPCTMNCQEQCVFTGHQVLCPTAADIANCKACQQPRSGYKDSGTACGKDCGVMMPPRCMPIEGCRVCDKDSDCGKCGKCVREGGVIGGEKPDGGSCGVYGPSSDGKGRCDMKPCENEPTKP